MAVSDLDPGRRTLTLTSSAASVTVRHLREVFPDDPAEDCWLVDWEVTHCEPRGLRVQGRTELTTPQLAVAFGLNDQRFEYGEWLIERYGGTAALQKRFIRYDEYLNIPCPGTGHDGDPNVSICLWPEIKQAIERLLLALH